MATPGLHGLSKGRQHFEGKGGHSQAQAFGGFLLVMLGIKSRISQVLHKKLVQL